MKKNIAALFILALLVACTFTIPPLVMRGRYVTSPGPDGSVSFVLVAEQVEPYLPGVLDAGQVEEDSGAVVLDAAAPPNADASAPQQPDAGVVSDAATPNVDVLALGLGTNVGKNNYWSGTWQQLNAWNQGRAFTDAWGAVAIIPWRAPNTQRVVTWTGSGDLTEIHGKRPNGSERQAKRFVYTSPAPSAEPWGIVRATGPLGDVRDVELSNETLPWKWHPAFVADLGDYDVLRYMDWGNTNNSPQTTWSSRPQPGREFPGETGGVSYEDMISLSNDTSKTPWICVPHMADDAYVLSLAQLISTRLDARLRVIIEYSNEVWNGMFTQFAWAGQQGLALGLSTNEHEARLRYVGRRTREIAAIMRPILGDRLIIVGPGQAASTWVSQTVMTACGDACQALAVAPYFMAASNASVDESIGWVKDQKAIAAASGVPLIAYEGGQHLLGSSCATPNRATSMGGYYDRYLTGWSAEGGGLFVHYDDVERFGGQGCWGALENHSMTSSPKRDALRRAAELW